MTRVVDSVATRRLGRFPTLNQIREGSTTCLLQHHPRSAMEVTVCGASTWIDC
ncbi:unnamed protein product [Linum tenue]|uniref:Uncharacterized protein n=1 Tax=Linum tenue TaxID=586396 RepID=A0AAV0I7Q1_9ROSI|nr:unnamed protein product [Linum tenue]